MNLENYDKIEHEDGRIELIPKKKDADWVPVNGQEYWMINEGGLIVSLPYENDRIDKKLLGNYNIYPTKELAEKAAKMMRRSNAIIRACLLVDPDFEPDWENCKNQKWHPSRNCENRTWGVTGAYRSTNSNPAYVSSEKKCKQACDLLTKWGVE